MVRFDLRQKILEGETYLINIQSDFIGCSFIYRFDGNNFIRELYHKNSNWFSTFKKSLTPKEFKNILSKIAKDDKADWIGILEK